MRNGSDINAEAFDERVVAFVDVIGFRNIVRRLGQDKALFVRVRDTLKSLQEQAELLRKYNDKYGGEKGPVPLKRDIQMTAFSDCYVISNTRPAWQVLASVQALASSLLAEGVLTRGAVVRGLAYHRDNVLFGPAVVDAYELESQVAKYPRILVSDEVRSAVWGYHDGLCRGQLLKQDVDGCWFVNALVPPLSRWAPLPAAATAQTISEHSGAVRRVLLRHLRDAKGNAGHLSKVRWLVHRFNRSVADTRSGWMISHPANEVVMKNSGALKPISTKGWSA